MANTPLLITSLSAIILAAIYMVQTFSVIAKRRSDKIIYGDGGDNTMMKRMRGHGNSAEQMPIFLILLGLAEFHGLATSIAAILAGMFILGRLLHGYYFLDIGAHHSRRRIGMFLTLLGQIFVILCLAVSLMF